MIIQTMSGRVRGSVGDGIARFFGISYAAAPIGALRFAAPEAPTSWEGERDATQFGPTAPQLSRRFPGLDIDRLIGKGAVRR